MEILVNVLTLNFSANELCKIAYTNPRNSTWQESCFPVCVLIRGVPEPIDALLVSAYRTYMIVRIFVFEVAVKLR